MATKDQYEFFMVQFSEEDTRNAILTKRAEIYLSIISLIFTGLLFKINDFKVSINSSCLVLWNMVAIVIGLIVSALFVILSLSIRDYEFPTDLQKYPDELGDLEPSDSEFYDRRIVGFIAATGNNQDINNRKGLQLKIAGYLMLVSIILIGLFILQFILI